MCANALEPIRLDTWLFQGENKILVLFAPEFIIYVSGINIVFRGRVVAAQEIDRLFCQAWWIPKSYGAEPAILYGAVRPQG